MAFAAAGYAVTGVDSDGLTAAVAAANLAVLGLGGSVIEGTAQDADRAGFAAVFADPARRQGATRVFDPRAFSPSWDFVLSLLGPRPSVAGQPGQVVVKLGPGLDHDLVPPLVEAEWVSLDGDLKEVALWSPPPSRGTTRRRATLLTAAGGEASLTEADAPVGAPPISAVGDFVYEPDPAVIRAHLVSVVVGEVAGWLLDPHLAYVSSDRDVASPFARRFRVLEVLPFRERQLRAALRSRGIGALTIKKRGIAVTPEELRRRLALHGDQHATLILTRTPGSAAALLVEPLPDRSPHEPAHPVSGVACSLIRRHDAATLVASRSRRCHLGSSGGVWRAPRTRAHGRARARARYGTPPRAASPHTRRPRPCR